jgi:Tol biopolymer transport system component
MPTSVLRAATPLQAGVVLFAISIALSLVGPGCFSQPRIDPREAALGLQGRLRQSVETSLAHGDWDDALSICESVEAANATDCNARYCDLVAHTMRVVDGVNGFLTPHSKITLFLKALFAIPQLKTELGRATKAADSVIAGSCEYDLPTVPLLVGSPDDPMVRGDIRGRWTTRDAHLLAALFDAMSYVLSVEMGKKTGAPNATPGQRAAPLPPLLAALAAHLKQHDALLFERPADPSAGEGGWLDRNGNRVPDAGDELLVDIFEPGSDRRVFDFSQADFVRGDPLPATPLTETGALPVGRCGYHKFHLDDLVGAADADPTDGMSFSPDGKDLVVPFRTSGKFQIYRLPASGPDAVKHKKCVTCDQPGNNDGVRWRPGGDVLLFVSDRDHPFALGNEGAGFGQELYAMRADGSQVTRLTESHTWATNYHPNWSPDGTKIVWGRTEGRTWDVMVADFAADDAGLRLVSPRRLVHDTTWWETHGFSSDGKAVIATSTRAGFLSSDIYAVDLADRPLRRLTVDPAWDEHAHVSPDGREIVWISGRFHPATVGALNDGSLSSIYDFFWIIPGIVFEFEPPAGYTTELTLMDADGNNVRRLTDDGKVVADSQWDATGRRIVFRQSDPVTGENKIRILTFDDCH